MECPICGEELNHHDSFGYFAGYGSGEKCGDCLFDIQIQDENHWIFTLPKVIKEYMEGK